MNELDRLVEQVNHLDIDERIQLIWRIKGRMMQERMRVANERYVYLLNIAKAATRDEMDEERRRETDVRIRMFVAYRMHIVEGFPLKDIGGCMRRSHSTVIHIIRNMENRLDYPATFKQDVYLYRRFNEYLKQKENGERMPSNCDSVPC